MTTLRGRSTAFTTSTNSNANILIQPALQNLTFSSLPTDSTGVIICKPNSLGITDKLDVVFKAALPDMTRLPSTGACADDITANVPREMLRSLLNMLTVGNTSCLPDTRTFIQTLTSYLNQTTSGPVAITRSFWVQLGRVFSEQNTNESKVNVSAAGVRSMAMAITTDAQSLPSNNMLLTTLSSISDLIAQQVPVIDEEFETDNAEFIKPQPDPADLLTEVVNQVPTTIGESSANPPTNMMDFTASDAAENIQVYDLDNQNTVEGQAYAGLKELFSVKTLTTPINTLKITRGGKVRITVPTVINFVQSVELVNNALEKVMGTATLMKEMEVDLSTLDLNKSLLEQDWAFALQNGQMSNGSKWISSYDIIHKPQLMSFSGEIVFKGVNSKKLYTLVEVQGISSALGSLWSKVVNMKLPTPEHIQLGTSIIAAGLGAAGQIFGSSGLLTASKIMGAVNQGLGAFIADLKPTNGLDPTPQASVPKNALSTMPSILEAGKSSFEQISLSAQHQRIMLHGIKNRVEAGYTLPSSQLQSVVSIRRNKQSFN